MKHERDGDANYILWNWNSLQRFGTWRGMLEIRGRVETIQAAVLVRLARILLKVLETWGDLLSLWLEWKTIS